MGSISTVFVVTLCWPNLVWNWEPSAKSWESLEIIARVLCICGFLSREFLS